VLVNRSISLGILWSAIAAIVGIGVFACQDAEERCSSCECPLDTETDNEQPSDTESDTDEQTGGLDNTCLGALVCIVQTPEQALSCMAGLDAETKSATIDLSACAFGACADTVDDLAAFSVCLMTDCSEEATYCIETSLTGVGL